MSHKKRPKKRQRALRGPAVVCVKCAGRAGADPSALLASLAAALNACDDAGLGVRLKHGAVYTGRGYVLPLAGDRWAARTLAYTEFPPDQGDGLDD